VVDKTPHYDKLILSYLVGDVRLSTILFFYKLQSGDRAVSPQIRRRKLSANTLTSRLAAAMRLEAASVSPALAYA
jgi:hypothetical protein